MMLGYSYEAFVTPEYILLTKQKLSAICGFETKMEFVIWEALRILAKPQPGKKGQRPIRVSFEQIFRFCNLFWENCFANLFGHSIILAEQLQRQLDTNVRYGFLLFCYKDGEALYWNAGHFKSERKIVIPELSPNQQDKGISHEIWMAEIVTKSLSELCKVRLIVGGLRTTQTLYCSLVEFTERSIPSFTLQDIQNYVRYSHVIQYPNPIRQSSSEIEAKEKAEILNSMLKDTVLYQVSHGRILVNVDFADGVTFRYHCAPSSKSLILPKTTIMHTYNSQIRNHRVPKLTASTNCVPVQPNPTFQDLSLNLLSQREYWDQIAYPDTAYEEAQHANSISLHYELPIPAKLPQLTMKQFYIQESSDEMKILILKQIKEPLEAQQSYIFCHTEERARILAKILRCFDMSCAYLGESPTVAEFQNSGLIRVLVLTDKSCRNPMIHLKRVPLVVSIDFPQSPEIYNDRQRLVGYSCDTLVGNETTNLLNISFVDTEYNTILQRVCLMSFIEEMTF